MSVSPRHAHPINVKALNRACTAAQQAVCPAVGQGVGDRADFALLKLRPESIPFEDINL